MKPLQQKPVTAKASCAQAVNPRVICAAREVIDRLCTANWRFIHRQMESPGPGPLVRAWLKFGASPRARSEGGSILALSARELSPLGAACQACFACGILGKTVPGGVPPHHPRRRKRS